MDSLEQDDTFDDYDWLPINAGSVLQQPYPTPTPFSPIQAPTQPFSQYMPTPLTAGSGNIAPKVAIPRLASSDALLHGRRRSARACEPCRQRKIKCDGIRPSCGQCAYNNHSCFYEDVKRVRDQKRLGSLVKRVDIYEALLREVEGEVDPLTARKIKKALKVSLVKCQMKSQVSSETRFLCFESRVQTLTVLSSGKLSPKVRNPLETLQTLETISTQMIPLHLWDHSMLSTRLMKTSMRMRIPGLRDSLGRIQKSIGFASWRVTWG